MCYIWCGIFPMDLAATIDIVPRSVAFFTTECGISHELS